MRFLVLLCFFFFSAAVYADPKKDDVAAYRSLLEQDLRLANVGYRLASANAPFCKNLSANPGWVIHDIAQYPDEAIARFAFGFEQPIQIAAVVEGGPAERAGVKAGDNIFGLDRDALTLKARATGKSGYERMADFKQQLQEKWRQAPNLPIALKQNGKIKNVILTASKVCASEFWVDSKSKVDAGADGDGVRITLGLMNYTPDDDELAAVVAHELAHNVLRHRARLSEIRKNKIKAVLATEIEADKLSVWLMANAGFDPYAAIRFWERRGPKSGLGILSGGTHLSWKSRIKVMQTEIDQLQQSEKHDGLLLPPLLADS